MGEAGQAGSLRDADKQARGPARLLVSVSVLFSCTLLLSTGVTWFHTHCLMQAPQGGTLTCQLSLGPQHPEGSLHTVAALQ